MGEETCKEGEESRFRVSWYGFRSLVCLCFFMFTASSDDAHAARRKYKKEVDKLKPDLEAYNKQKEAAMGLAPGTLTQSGSSTFSLDVFDPSAASSSQVIHLVSPMPLTNTESVLSDGSHRLPATGGSREPLPGRE